MPEIIMRGRNPNLFDHESSTHPLDPSVRAGRVQPSDRSIAESGAGSPTNSRTLQGKKFDPHPATPRIPLILTILRPVTQSRIAAATLGGLIALWTLAGCDPGTPPADTADVSAAPRIDPLALVLSEHTGDSIADEAIRHHQDEIRANTLVEANLERLGWAYVAKERETFDPGYHKLAEACARILADRDPNSAEALLLQGHVDQCLHRFHQAEIRARRLVDLRGNPYDHSLLGDTLMEQGKIDEAIPVYQEAINLRPDLQTYSRAAYLRWILGSPGGAIELMRLAVGASTPSDPTSLAWATTRLATFQFQTNRLELAEQSNAQGLAVLPDYAPALLLEGRMRLAAGDATAALESLCPAATINPLPDAQWTLADALRETGATAEAKRVEAEILANGEQTDPRTFALFLATRGLQPATAVRLAGEELKNRQDIFTHDAYAWALDAAGRTNEALPHLDRALAEGTEDGRLYLHASVIFFHAGRLADAQRWHDATSEIAHTLLPSERSRLSELERELTATLPPPDSPEYGSPKPSHQTNS